MHKLFYYHLGVLHKVIIVDEYQNTVKIDSKAFPGVQLHQVYSET